MGFLLLSNFLFAQKSNCNLKLSGQVTDEHDGSALSFSSLWLIAQKRGVAADENGFFEIDHLCPDTYQIVISHIGCEPDTIALNLKESTTVKFSLEHHLEELKSVEVTAQHRQEVMSESEQLKSSELDENRGKPLAEILKQINGVSSLKTGSNVSKPMIGGLSNNRVKILNHGVQHQAQSWGDEHAPEIDPFAPADYSVIKGAGALKYTSGALGGVVLASPKLLPQKVGINGELNALYATNNRMMNTSLMLEGRSALIPKLSARIQGSWKRSGNVKTPNFYQKNTGVREYNGSFDLGYFDENWNARIYLSQFNSDIGIFSGAHIGNLTDLQNAIAQERPKAENIEGFSYRIRRPKQRIIHELAMGEFNWYSEQMGKFNFQFSRQFNIREEFDKERPRNNDLAALNIPELSLSLESFTSNLNWTKERKGEGKTEAGLQWVDRRNSVNSFRDFIPDYTANDYSFYFIQTGKLQKINWEMGVRLEQTNRKVDKLINREFQRFEPNFFTYNANLGLSYLWKDRLKLKWNLTYAERAPAINELFSEGLHHGSASLEFGDRTLTKEQSFASGFSANWEQNRWHYHLYAHAQWVEDFIYLKPQGLDLTIRGAFPSFQWSNTNALISGIDQSLSFRINDQLSWVNELSLIWGSNQKDDNFLINMPANRWKSFLTYEPSGLSSKKNLKLTIGNQLVFRQERFNPEEEIAPPPSSYQLLFANITYRIALSKARSLEMGLRADNLLNEVYRDYLNRFRFFTDEQGRNLTFRIKLNF